MSMSDLSFASLCNTTWLGRVSVLADFESAWRAGDRPSIEAFLPPDRTADTGLLVELIHLELELRHRAGEPIEAADYLRRFPDLAASDQRIRDLIGAVDRLRGGAPGGMTGADSAGMRVPNSIEGQNSDADPGTDGTLPRMVGKYDLLSEAGRGVLAVVFRARDTQLDRIVAVKLPHSGFRTDADAKGRFHREARNLARLKHPGLVAVYDAIELEDSLAIVSEFIDGETLAARLSRAPVTRHAAAELVSAVADALGAAHRAGVIHRDLKPANIMLDGDGRPRVMDFGLAKLAADEPVLSRDGQLLGTPAYMSPEQASGNLRSVDECSDVYSLGVILYELLTGRLPFQGSCQAVITRIIEGQPLPPRRLSRAIPADLETICLKAMASEPGRRYPSADALADDLRRWRAGRPITARPVSRARRAWRACRRQPIVAALLAALVLTFTLGLMGAIALVGRAGAERARARDARHWAEEYQRFSESATAQLNNIVSASAFASDTSVRDQFIAPLLKLRDSTLNLRRQGPKVASSMARLESRVSAALIQFGEWPAAREILAYAVGDLGQTVLQNPGDRDAGLEYAGCLFNAARSAGDENRYEESLEFYERSMAQYVRLDEGLSLQPLVLIYNAVSITSALVPQFVEPERVLRARRKVCAGLAQVCDSRSQSFAAKGLDPEGWDCFSTILRAHQAIWPHFVGGSHVAQEQSGQFFAAWMIDHGPLSRRLAAAPGDDDAPKMWAGCVLATIRERRSTLGVSQPTTAAICLGLADRLQGEASFQRKHGQLERAQRTATELMALARALVRELPQCAESHVLLCKAYNQIAKNARKIKDRREALRSLEMALGAARDALRLDPLNEDARLHAARVAKNLDDIKAEIPQGQE
jgi:hypothetical protein